MANISTQPIGTPAAGDLIPGTQQATDASGKTVNLTRNFSVSAISSFATNNYVEVTKTLSNAEWLALATASIQIVPTPGVGKAIQVILAHVKWVKSGANFEWNQPLHLSNGTTGAIGVTVQGTIPVTLSDVDGDGIQTFTVSGADVSLNAAINFGCPNAATITGGGTLSITVRYQVI